MMKNNIKRLMMAIIMAVTMIFAMCACAAAEPNESDKKDSEVVSEVTETEKKDDEKEAESEVKEEATEAKEEETSTGDKSITSAQNASDIGLTEDDVKFISSAIEKELQEEYLTPNNIQIENFSIPADDESWKFFVKCCTIVFEEPDMPLNELSDLVALIVPLSSENDQTIMTIIATSFTSSIKELDKAAMITMLPFDDSVKDNVKVVIISNVFADTVETETE